MNAARQLITDAHRQGASFHLIGDRLRLVPETGCDLSPSLIERAKALRSEIAATLSADRLANLATRAEPSAGVAARKNHDARRAGMTDRWCDCGSLASFAWPIGDQREVWRCLNCARAEEVAFNEPPPASPNPGPPQRNNLQLGRRNSPGF
jgi:hypothetical protein